MILKGSKIISQLPDGRGIVERFELELDDDSVKQLIRIASRELMLDSGMGELLAAAERVLVLWFRGQIAHYPAPIENTEQIPESALDRLVIAVKKVQKIVEMASKPTDAV